MLPPSLEFVYELNASLGAPVVIGNTPDGMRRIIPILAGTVEGPRIQGTVLSGADWQLIRPDGVTVADATYAVRTLDGSVIQIRNKGLRHGAPEVMAALMSGRPVDPSQYYFRSVPEFIASAGPYEWLNCSIFIGSGARYPDSVKLWVWRVC